MQAIVQKMREELARITQFLTDNGEAIIFSTWTFGEENFEDKMVITAGIIVVTENDDDYEYVGRGEGIMLALADLNTRITLAIDELEVIDVETEEEVEEDSEEEYIN